MTEEQIKEKMSDAFVAVVANRNGYKLQKPDDTGGVDWSVTYDKVLTRNGKTRHIHSGQYVELQLKATVEHRIVFENDHLKYDLEAKTYNDLIERYNDGNAPLVLVLAILPNDRADWAAISQSDLCLNQRVYYFYPDDQMLATTNQNSIRVSIPYVNKIEMNFFENLFQEHYG